MGFPSFLYRLAEKWRKSEKNRIVIGDYRNVAVNTVKFVFINSKIDIQQIILKSYFSLFQTILYPNN